MSSSLPEEELKKEHDDLKSLLTCGLCSDLLKKPTKILPCLHSFCSSCYYQHTCSSSSSSSSSSPPSPIKCPVCDREFNASETENGGAQASPFPDSRVDRLNELKDHFDSTRSIPLSVIIKQCDECDSSQKEDASVRCGDCKKNLCYQHNSAHSISNKGHTIVDISEASSSHSDHRITRVYPPLCPKCPKHTFVRADKYCLDCNVSICEDCLIEKSGGHKDHNISNDLSRSETHHSYYLHNLTEAVEESLKDLDKSLSLIDQMETKIQETLISQKAKIISLCEDLKAQHPDQMASINQKQEGLLNELETKSKAKLDKLAQQRKRFEADLSCLENSVKVSRSFLKNASDHQLSSQLHFLSDQLTRLKEDKNLLQRHAETTFLELDEVQSVDLNDLLKAIKLVDVGTENDIQAATDFKKDQGNLVKNPSLVFGSKGSQDGQFDSPRRCAIDKDNRIIVSDSNNNRIQIFDDQGKHLKSFGSQGSHDGQLNRPQSAAINLKNRIIVCDTDNNRIQIFDDQGNHLYSFGSKGSGDGQFDTPIGITIDKRTNNILVGDDCHRIQIFDDQGNHLHSFGSQGSGDGQFSACNELTIDQHGNILVTDWGNNRVQVFDVNGNFITKFGTKGSGPGQFFCPQGITIDHQGRIIVCDVGNHRIQIFG